MSTRPHCRFRDLWQVFTELALGFALLHALLWPKPYTIMWFIDTAAVVVVMEATMLMPLGAGGWLLQGRHRSAQWLGLAAGALVALVCYAFGGAWFSLVVGLQVHARISGLADEPDLSRYQDSDLKWMMKNRWWMQYLVFFAAGFAGTLAWQFRDALSPEARALLRVAGGAEHSLREVIAMLGWIAVYFILTAVHSAVRMPCLRKPAPAAG